MSDLIKTRSTRAKYFTSQLPQSTVAVKESQYADFFNEAMMATGGNVLAAWDTMAMEDKNLRSAINREFTLKSKSNQRIGYNDVSEILDEAEETKRAAGIYDTTTPSNAGNLVQTTIADYIVGRVEELGQVASLVNRFKVSTGNLSIPVFPTNPIAQFGLEGSALSNGNPNVNQVTINPNQYGIYFGLTLQFLAKVNPKNMSYIMNKLAEAMARAIDYGILNGTGTGGNLTGLLNTATSVTPGTTIFDTVDTMIAQASIAKIPMDKLTLLMNGALAAKAMAQRRTGANYGAYLTMKPGENSGYIDGVKYIITEQLLNAGSVGSQTASLTMGNFDHYFLGDNGAVNVVIDNYTGITNLTQKVVSYGFAGGQPVFNDSFLKATTVTGL